MHKLLISFITISIVYFLLIGSILIVSPNGFMLGMTPSLLKKSPFTDYLFPGSIMVVGIGFPLLISFYQIITHRKNRYNWSVFSGLLMLLFAGLQFNYTDSSIWLDISLIAVAVFIMLSALQLKGGALI